MFKAIQFSQGGLLGIGNYYKKGWKVFGNSLY